MLAILSRDKFSQIARLIFGDFVRAFGEFVNSADCSDMRMRYYGREGGATPFSGEQIGERSTNIHGSPE